MDAPGVNAPVPEPLAARMAVLDEIGRSITSSLELDEVLARIAQAAGHLCASDTASIFLRDRATGVMVPRFRVGALPSGYEQLSVRPGQGIGGEAWQSGRPVRTANY